MEILLIRHGETEWNVSNVFRGRKDVSLSKNGLQQAELLAGYLATRRIDAIYSSPLKRALQTADAIARHQRLKVQVHPGLIDLNFGEWEGLSRQQAQEKYRELYSDWLEKPHLVRMPGGERLEDVRKRALAVVADVIAKNKGTIALVSHRVVCKVLICALLGLDDSHFWNIEQDTCGITVFTHDGTRFVLRQHNDTSFMTPGHPRADF